MCQYCEAKEEKLYQENVYGNLYIDRFGIKTFLIIKPEICPPYSRCSAKNIPVNLAFSINYCPECGRKL